MKIFIKIVVVLLLSLFYGCSDSDSDEYFEIFEKEIKNYKYTDKKYYFEKKDYIIVDDFWGIFSKNILIFRDYSLLDSNKNTVLNLNLWREGALKENHGDVLTLTKMDYENSVKDSFIIKKISKQNSYGMWGPYSETTILETLNKNNYIIQRKIIDENKKDTLSFIYDYNKNEFVNYIISNALHEKSIEIAFDGNVIIEQIHDGRHIHILGNINAEKLSKFINNWTSLYFYDDNFRILEEKYFERGKIIWNNFYRYSSESGNEIVKIYDKENNLIRTTIKNVKPL